MSYRLFSFLLCALLSLAAQAGSIEDQLRAEGEIAKQNADLYYDEIFDKNGELRPAYKDLYPALLKEHAKMSNKVRRLTKKDFLGDNALSRIALVVDHDEHEMKRKGVEQRGRALLKFLQDHYSGKKSYLEAGVIPREVIDRIIERTGESGYAGHIDPKTISFSYGPDVIRDKDGIFRVLEDNNGFVGGQGDLKMARESLFRHVPEYEQILGGEKLNDPGSYYRELHKIFQKQMKDPKAKMVYFSVPPYSDEETKRLVKLWGELGVEAVTPFSRNPKLVKRPDGMYLEHRKGKSIRREKIGYMIFDSEFHGRDPGFAPSHEQYILTSAKEWLSDKSTGPRQKEKIVAAMKADPKTGRVDIANLEKVLRHDIGIPLGSTKVPGLVEAVANGTLPTNNTPGGDFINDKEFNMYVEDIVRFYEKEEPILRNLRTYKLYDEVNGSRQVNQGVLAKLKNNMDQYVVKVVDGRGGDGVWVGPKLSRKERQELIARLQADTTREVIVQQYAHPSVLAGDIVDERILAFVSPEGIHVSETGWSRGVGMDGDGKVNLSAGKAHEVTVITRYLRAKACAEQYRSLRAH